MTTAVSALADDLTRLLGDAAVSVDPRARRVASTDWAHLSPVLSAKLPAGLADVVAYPATADEIAVAVAAAHRRQVPVTPRGQGTGNYGQAIPLRDGLVVDTSRADKVLDVGEGYLTAEAGASFVAMEAAARRAGQELALLPSTVGSAIGGFLAGGASGTGAIENGFLWDGFVQALDLVPCTDEGTPVTLTGLDTRPALHAYGTTGVIARATVRLRPARTWEALFASFGAWSYAVAAGRELMLLAPAPRLLSIDEPELVGLLATDDAMPPGRVSLRATVTDSTLDAARRIVTGHGGQVEAVRPRGAAYLASLSFNHVTHRAKRSRPGIAHLQLGGECAELPAVARAAFDEPLVHLDGIRHGMEPGADGWPSGGQTGFGGLLLSRFTSVETFYAAVEVLRAAGVRVVDPHTWLLSGDLDALRAAAARFDPDGLLNPGKLPPASASSPRARG